ncbi:MAG: DUF4249 domain-containing protein [Bacteroidetes Order II. Incertae sedis bacterium]|nr:DUF4249 domain-containing protein [Bacteroidetes Order II. bacterium]
MKYIFLIIGPFLFWGCDFEQVVDINIPLKPQLVLNGALNPDSSLTIQLSKNTNSVGEHKMPEFVQNATVTAWEDGVIVGNMKWIGVEGRYRLENVYPQAGKTYRIKASAAGFPDVEAETTIPKPIQLSANIVMQGQNATLKLVLTDVQEEINYYMLAAYTYHPETTLSGSDGGPRTLPASIGWANCSVKASFLPASSFELEGMGQYCSGRRMLFSDVLMKAKENPFEILLSELDQRDGVKTCVVVAAIPKILIDYDATTYNNNSDLGLFSEPMNVLGNVKGGLGLLISYNGVRYDI